MKKRLIGAIAGMIMAGAAWAQTVVEPVPGIETTIRSQMDAFLADDFATAFSFASPGIRSMFGSPERFGAMVRNGYPMVWRPDDVRFGDLVETPRGLAQRVTVLDGAGARHVLEYSMVRQGDEWLIAGVRILDAPDPAV